MQVAKLYPNFCLRLPETLPCDDGDYFLKGRECDGALDCEDGSDERPALIFT